MTTPMLKIADNLSLPADAVTQTFSILAKRGVGKTYTASVLAEEMLKAGQTIIAIDPTGAWWGLRSIYPVVICGGEHADVPLEESAGEIVARSIVENRFSAVIDLSLFRKGQLIRFMVAFAETLYRLNREAVHLFVDEADAVAPQAKNYGGDENRMLGAMEDIVRRGRKRGIGCTLITQRPAVLNKNVLTQCENVLAMRMVHPKDIDAIEEWVNVHGDPAVAKEMIESLPSLPIGSAWFWSPGWLNQFKRVKIRTRETFDSGATPKPGEAERRPKRLAEIDLTALGEQIRATVERAKAEDPKELRKQIAALTKQLEAKAPVVDQSAVDHAVSERDREWKSAIANHEKIIGGLKGRLDKIGQLAHVNGESIPKSLPVVAVASRPSKAVREPVQNRARPSQSVTGTGDTQLNKSERAILTAIYWLRGEQATPAKVGFYADYSSGSGSFNNALGRLRSSGLLQGWSITSEGEIAVRSLGGDEKPTGGELREWLRRKLNKAENALLDALCEAHPNRLTADELGNASNYSSGSGSFNNALGKLRSIEAAIGYEREGGTKAADVFFE